MPTVSSHFLASFLAAFLAATTLASPAPAVTERAVAAASSLSPEQNSELVGDLSSALVGVVSSRFPACLSYTADEHAALSCIGTAGGLAPAAASYFADQATRTEYLAAELALATEPAGPNGQPTSTGALQAVSQELAAATGLTGANRDYITSVDVAILSLQTAAASSPSSSSSSGGGNNGGNDPSSASSSGGAAPAKQTGLGLAAGAAVGVVGLALGL